MVEAEPSRNEVSMNIVAGNAPAQRPDREVFAPRNLRILVLGGLAALYALSLVLPGVRHFLGQIAALLPR
jgi:hypothetical protein